MPEPINIPRLIDEPPTLLIWNADEMAPFALGALLGVLSGKTMPFLALGIAVTTIYRRFRDGHADGWILHALYWIGAVPSKARTIPNPYARRYFPCG